ncbi:MAG TPA: rod shape-determining protein MreC [Mycobacteriales bacterium]|nr:rod shape-determining protein MreC [Mycobacteriales bacterium]
MRDSRRARLVLALLLLTAFTLITLDYRSNAGGPFRTIGNAVFGPVERAVADVARPVGSFFGSLGHLSSYRADNAKLRKQNQALREQLRLTDAERARLRSMEQVMGLAGRAQFRIVPAQVIAVDGALGFEWTATIDVGSRDGIQTNMTVINGDGLVGKTVEVGPTTTTVLLGRDPKFTAGARLEGTNEIGHVDGGGRQPMTFTLLGSSSTMKPGDRLVSFASIGNRPFVAEVPIGRIVRVFPEPGQLFRTAVVAPFVDFTSIDVVGVVVASPRTIRRDSLLPPSPRPSPSQSRSPGRSPSPTPSPSGTG